MQIDILDINSLPPPSAQEIRESQEVLEILSNSKKEDFYINLLNYKYPRKWSKNDIREFGEFVHSQDYQNPNDLTVGYQILKTLTYWIYQWQRIYNYNIKRSGPSESISDFESCEKLWKKYSESSGFGHKFLHLREMFLDATQLKQTHYLKFKLWMNLQPCVQDLFTIPIYREGKIEVIRYYSRDDVLQISELINKWIELENE